MSSILQDKMESGVFVVAEIGKNFIQTEDEKSTAEYLENAKALTYAAKCAGADAVKFQTHYVEDEVLSIDFDSPHFKGKNRYEWVKRNMEVTPFDSFWRPLQEYCNDIGVVFFSTPMSRGAAIRLQELDVPFWKVASSDILDFPLIEYMLGTRKTIIIPSGMSTLEDFDTCVDYLRRHDASFILMHAISRYPYPAEDSHLLTIPFFQKRYPEAVIGFSQNSPWIDPALVAVALGARMLEQHFTFDRGLWGPDHKVSMVPEELQTTIEGIRKLEANEGLREKLLVDPDMQKYLGSEDKILQSGEVAFRGLFRKSLMAAQYLPAGTILAPEDIYAMRPQQFAGGLPSERYEQVLGKKTRSALKRFDPITEQIIA